MTQSPPPDDADSAVTLRLLCTTDVHGHVLDHDYYRDTPGTAGSLQRLAPLIASARAAAPSPCLLFDCGDGLQGTPLTDWAATAPDGTAHPVIVAMNALGYDGAALGNHDFNYGLEALRRALSTARFPVLASNLGGQSTGAQRTALLDCPLPTGAPLRVGLFGLVPPQILDWDAPLLHGRVTAEDMVTTAEACAAELRRAGADLVIGLAHSGFSAMSPHPGMENALAALRRMSGIDVWFGGHTHLTYASGTQTAPWAEAPAVIAGDYGRHLGQIDLHLSRNGARWHPVRAQAQVHPAPTGPIKADPAALTSRLSAAHSATRARNGEAICTTDTPLHTFFAGLGPCPALDLIAESQRAYLARNLANGPWADLPVLAAVAPFRGGGRAGPSNYTNIGRGPIRAVDVSALYPFTNSFVAVRVTGRELRLWIERAARRFRTIAPGSTGEPLLNAEFPSHNLDLFPGLTCTLDLSRPPRRTDEDPGRVIALHHGTTPVDDNAWFAVASNAYRINGGGGFTAWPADRRILSSGEPCSGLLANHLRQIDKVPSGPAKRTVAFTPLGATVTVETGPAAALHSAEGAALGLTLRGPTRAGFLLWHLAI